jgi:GT2 family glycosyltransferase
VISDVSVVVCAHDDRRWNVLREALTSLENQTLLPREIIVVIDHNPALLQRAARELRTATVVDNSEEQGLGGARNAGTKASAGSIVAFLDDDAIASRDWLRLLRSGYENPEVAGVGGWAEPIWERGRPRWFPPEFDWVVGCTFHGAPESPTAVRNFFGCNMSYRREILLELGLFRLGYGCDETEFCIRLGQRWPERRLLFLPDAKIFHRVPADRARFRRYLSRCYFEGGSKAVVSRLVGARDGLAAERSYTAQILPRALARDVRHAVSRGDSSGLGRAAAIVAGLGATTAGYLGGRIAPTPAARKRGWQGPPLRFRQDRTTATVPFEGER